MKFYRYRVVKYLVFILPLFYLAIVGLKPVLSTHKQETIPFFSWQLFSWTPQWDKKVIGVVAHSIGNEPVTETRYLIPGNDIRDLKILRMVIDICNPSFQSIECAEIVRQTLYPAIKRISQSDSVTFGIVKGIVDMREVREDITDLAEGKTSRTDYYQIDSIMSAWLGTEDSLEKITLSYAQLRDIKFNFKGKHLPENAVTTEQFMAQTLNDAQPLIHSVFDVYLKENKLIFFKELCPLSQEPPFFLHLVPVDKNNLPGIRGLPIVRNLPIVREKYGFDNLDFKFDKRGRGLRFEEKCVVVIPLPDYAIKTIRTGQWLPDEGKHLWEASFDFTGQSE